MPEQISGSAEAATDKTTENLNPAQIEEQVQRLRFLETARADLSYKLYQRTGRTKAEREGEKVEGQLIFAYGESPQVPEEGLSLAKERELILAGEIGQIKINAEPEESAQGEAVKELEEKRSEIEREITQIIKNPEVMNAYNDFRQNKIELIKKTNEAHRLESYLGRIDRQEVAILRGVKQGLTAPESEVLARLNERRGFANERLRELQEDREVARALRVHEILDYKKQLEKNRFAETPSRKEYMTKVMNHWLQGKPMMLTGPTGTGKTEIFRALTRKYWGRELSSTLISGSELVSDYTLFGKTDMRAVGEGEKKASETLFSPAGFTVGMEQGLPVILDEFDLLAPNTRLRLKALYNFRPGQTYTIQEDTSYPVKIKKGFCIGATANLKSAKYKERFALDATENRVWEEARIDYLPKEELFDLCFATLVDRRGRLPLSKNDTESLAHLVDAATFIQETFMEKQTEIFKKGDAARAKYEILEQAVLDPGKVLGFLEGWNEARARNVGFQDFIEEQLLDFIKKEGYGKDSHLLAQILIQKYGFFAGYNAQELSIPDLDEKELTSWRATKKSKKGAQ